MLLDFKWNLMEMQSNLMFLAFYKVYLRRRYFYLSMAREFC